MPLREDWAVLDGLNYVKDRLDGTPVVPLVVPDGDLRQLRHDRQRRPGADLRDVPRRLRAGTGAGRAARRTSRSSATSSSRSTTSCASCPRSSPGSCARTSSRVADVEFLQTPGRARRVQAVQHVHQLHALLLRRARCTRSSRTSSARPRSRSPSATTWTPATRARTSGWTCWPPRRGCGPAPMSGNARRPAPRASIPAGAIQRYKLTAATRTLRSLLLPRGAR